jgi:hypothetical protein
MKNEAMRERWHAAGGIEKRAIEFIELCETEPRTVKFLNRRLYAQGRVHSIAAKANEFLTEHEAATVATGKAGELQVYMVVERSRGRDIDPVDPSHELDRIGAALDEHERRASE